MLLRLEDVRSVTATHDGERAASNVTVCKTACERATRGVLLAVLAATGATILDVDATSIEFEIAGSDLERAKDCDLLRRYWPIEIVSSSA